MFFSERLYHSIITNMGLTNNRLSLPNQEVSKIGQRPWMSHRHFQRAIMVWRQVLPAYTSCKNIVLCRIYFGRIL